jgi:thiol:disulfide interchange protein DsbG
MLSAIWKNMRLGTWAAALGAVLLSSAALPADYARLFPELERSGYVAEGAAVPQSVLYVFFDANCYYCNLTWKALQPYEKAGLQVRWVPVAYQKPSSTGRAAAVMEAPDRAAALRANELGYKPQTYDGGIKPLAKVRPATLKMLRANLDLMKRFGAPGTPAVVWKDSGGNVGFRNAVPRLSELPRITGLPAQRIDDPDLAEFR